MDTNVRRRRTYKPIVDTTNNSLFTHDISMYKEPPHAELPLTEFEDLALERLQLLRIIEQASLKGNKIFSEDWKKSIKEDLLKSNLKKYLRLLAGVGGQSDADIQARRADHISHFILRLAYCRSEELRRWFLAREVEWFKVRFLSLNSHDVLSFLHANNLIYHAISEDEKSALTSDLISSTANVYEVSCDMTDFYKVPFTDALALVKSRKVFLKNGYAYVPSSEVVVCVQSEFRASLSLSLMTFNQRLPQVDDDRVSTLLFNLYHSYTGTNFSYATDKYGDTEEIIINEFNIDTYAKKNFPLCMRHIHDMLRSTHHLKHNARLQYGLFLKGIGLLYVDALRFFRQEFTKTLEPGKFDKEYTYYIKHNYGLVGNRVNYSPWSCIKIITTNVGAGEVHGCPFRCWDKSNLKQKVTEHGISAEGTRSIMELVSDGHYQIACTKYFEYTHGQPPAVPINHPNQYFEESRTLTKANKKTTNLN